MKSKLNSICSIKTGYSFRGQPVASEDGNLYILQAKDINTFGEINYQKCVKISTVDIKHIPLLSQGEIVLTARGSFKAALFESDKPFLTSNALFVLEVNSRYCYNKYLALWLNSPACRKQLEKVALTSTTIATLPRNALDNIIIDLPSIDIQREIVKTYVLNNKYFKLQQEIYNLRKMQLENLMKGEMI